MCATEDTNLGESLLLLLQQRHNQQHQEVKLSSNEAAAVRCKRCIYVGCPLSILTPTLVYLLSLLLVRNAAAGLSLLTNSPRCCSSNRSTMSTSNNSKLAGRLAWESWRMQQQQKRRMALSEVSLPSDGSINSPADASHRPSTEEAAAPWDQKIQPKLLLVLPLLLVGKTSSAAGAIAAPESPFHFCGVQSSCFFVCKCPAAVAAVANGLLADCAAQHRQLLLALRLSEAGQEWLCEAGRHHQEEQQGQQQQEARNEQQEGKGADAADERGELR
ncbi:hypothetical protein Emag_006165 [Eimeria magna]